MEPHNCRHSRATDMHSFDMALWEIGTDGTVPFNDMQLDFEVREEWPPINPAHRCPEMFPALITKC